jgi:phosphoheptose isomerase
MVNYTHLKELFERYPQLVPVEDQIAKSAECIINCFREGSKLLICGNGGSSSDSDHIVGELMKGLEHKRQLAE